jgi:AcrR family transcriptional regulator
MNTALSDRPNSARARIYQTALRLFAENGGSALSVSDLADAAGIARGTVYNNVDEPENLFGEIVAGLSREMIVRTELTMQGIEDPALRMATGLRLFIRRAHEDHDWGRFLLRFAFSHALLHGMMREPPARDIARGVASGRFKLGADKVPALLSMLTGTTLAAMSAVIRGDQTWRAAGSNAAELMLRAAGLGPGEARRIATAEMAPLAMPEKRNKPRRTA